MKNEQDQVEITKKKKETTSAANMEVRVTR